jgi:hypothetical protein
MMNADGNDQHLFYDSGSHDADIDWADDTIVFTSGFKIWSIKDDGTGLTQITNPDNAGQWGQANLPVGDCDPTGKKLFLRSFKTRQPRMAATTSSLSILTVHKKPV